MSNTVFINRANHKSAIEAFNSAAEHMTADRQSVFIFPEGTRSYSSKPELLPFKKGAFHLAIKAQVPIIPVVCANYNYLLSMQEKRFSSGRIPVKALGPFETKGLKSEDAEELMGKVRETMLAALKELYVETSSSPAKYLNGAAKSVAPTLRENGKIALASS